MVKEGESLMSREVYFVGSIPLERTIQVFEAIADSVGDRAARIPDGELGDRKYWVSSQYPVLAASPAIQYCAFPEEGLTRKSSYELPLRVRQGATPKDFKLLPLNYARHAIASYGLFDAMQKAGKLPSHWRFQVNLPLPMDVMSMVEPESRPTVEAAYQEALLAEMAQIQELIPANKLSTTIDIVRGVLFWEDPGNKYFPAWFDNPMQTTVEKIREVADAVKGDAELGLHLCYGSQDHKHAIEPKDLSACVNLTNAVVKAAKRPISYVHMPVPRDRSDEQFFSPLANLDKSVKDLFLGLIHYTDGVDGAKRRIAAAKKYRESFGIATECGFGRRPSHQDILQLIKLHALIADNAG